MFHTLDVLNLILFYVVVNICFCRIFIYRIFCVLYSKTGSCTVHHTKSLLCGFSWNFQRQHIESHKHCSTVPWNSIEIIGNPWRLYRLHGVPIHSSCTCIFMAALCNSAGHYIFALWFLSSIFCLFSSPNLSGRRLDVYHTSTHGVALLRI